MNFEKLKYIGAEKSGYAFGAIDNLSGIAYVLLGFALIGGLGVILIGEFSKMAQAGNHSGAVTFLGYVLGAYNTLGGFLGIIVLALVIMIVVGVVRGFQS